MVPVPPPAAAPELVAPKVELAPVEETRTLAREARMAALLAMIHDSLYACYIRAVTVELIEMSEGYLKTDRLFPPELMPDGDRCTWQELLDRAKKFQADNGAVLPYWVRDAGKVLAGKVGARPGTCLSERARMLMPVTSQIAR